MSWVFNRGKTPLKLEPCLIVVDRAFLKGMNNCKESVPKFELFNFRKSRRKGKVSKTIAIRGV
jgi:hypothetical protein